MGPAERLAQHLLPVVRVEGEDLRYAIDDRLAAYDCPGVSVAVIENGELAWAAGYGRIEPGGAAVDADTLFAGASISKPVTAMIALRLVERGLLRLDEDINGQLTSWKLPENALTREVPVTLRMLLGHRAGTTVHGFGGTFGPHEMPTVHDILEGRAPARNEPVRVDKLPGGDARYSGGGTTIVQLMIEEATGKSFAEVAQEEIFEPLGMTRSTFARPLPGALQANAAVGYENGEVIPYRYSSTASLAAGGIWTTASDYARFLIAARDAARGGRPDLLGGELAREMMRREGTNEFGLGWSLVGEGDERRFGHGGSNPGYQCESFLYEGSGKGAVVMTNSESGLIFYWEVFNGIADLYGWPGFLQPPKRIMTIPPSDFALYTGDFDIVSGVEMPLLRMFVSDGRLRSEIPGMRAGVQDVLLDDRGRMFNRNSPFESELVRDADGRVVEIVAYVGGTTEIMRAKRRGTS
ncbi:MAG TPA: serine hydrolase [Sphingopyxis sp.]|uniref:serine hydrolase domain-containing protein n=1 Tax=Sphingopyxis sp. TaxID=1908224 RepID=UPI002C6049A1|nr:serine hydrolase [Sphingopyxis sp.]HWW57968.1 serine hydrolase [Sphingopyxis sp.]